ncbi:hypothetical protein EXW62_19790 [Bacillus mycoides]|uniref:hypothetical protein n=1 Tax=Bacillus mycoides TaxID=1405 RepID=UPI001C02D9E6|nr:hypothetical protein [Bacillus mycoides]QWH19213.1 hypothetical protein EXW62_19790 [Bacillus mycoides]
MVKVQALENWKMIQEFDRQGEKAHEMQARYTQKVEDAKAVVREETVKYEMLLRKEFEGEDVAVEKEKALTDIEKAKAAVKVAEEESHKAYTYSNEYLHGKIRIHDLVNDFNQNIAPQIRKEDIYPLFVQAENALYDYYDALAKIYSIREEIRPTLDWLNDRSWAQKGPFIRATNPASESNLYFPRPTDENLKYVKHNRHVPQGYAGLTKYQINMNNMEQYREAEKEETSEAAAKATKKAAK